MTYDEDDKGLGVTGDSSWQYQVLALKPGKTPKGDR